MLIALAAGLGATVITAVAIIAFNGDDDRSVDVMLDVPGEYQTPGIATNAPVQGTLLSPATVFDLDDQEIDTALEFFDAADQRPLLINCWFSNCQPCKR